MDNFTQNSQSDACTQRNSKNTYRSPIGKRIPTVGPKLKLETKRERVDKHMQPELFLACARIFKNLPRTGKVKLANSKH